MLPRFSGPEQFDRQRKMIKQKEKKGRVEVDK